MGLFDGLSAGLQFNAARTSAPDDVYPASGGLFGLAFRKPVAGVPVHADSAMTYSAVWACTELISNHIAMLPWRVFRSDGNRRLLASEHPADGLLFRLANTETKSFDFRKALILQSLLKGNGFAEIERTRAGDPAGLWSIDWNRVNPDRDRRGRLIYDVMETNGPNTVFEPHEVIHVRGGPSFDGVTGLSPIDYAKQCISHGLAMEQFGAAFFGNGALPGGVIEWNESVTGPEQQPENWDADAAKNLKKSWLKTHRGSENYGGVQILEPGQTFKSIAVSPEQAQFLGSRQFGVVEVCRWFGVKPHKIAALERSTNNNIESENISHVTDTILPRAVQLEQELDCKLFGRDTRYYNKLNLGALLRGDLKTRQEFYKTMMDRGVYSIDEVRAFEDMNPLEDDAGDLRLVQMNMVSVEQAKANGNTVQNKGASGAG